ncbi:HNH endonuclease [Haloarcula virus HVTV-2]|uniref:HNH domain endonuclease n=1 Tax=Haloarcula vallismortis tailed virus 1 TaxID=1262528 RepID=L7TKH0_9CAUD|nr:HNH endonuclease [Haloarcula vallismortis tailed virus 1]AGC34480.1 HNH domain endonuclease [Haloarcula vallismortis tailed virus 1]UBF22918.1 HNH endonuclease [Haloarcula virus HVTV-2]
MVECPTCSKELRTEHGLKQHHAKVHGESLAYKQCEQCGDEFKPTWNSEKQRFCSQECSSEHLSNVRSKEWQGEGHPQWQERDDCGWCGDELHRSDIRFCSQDCANSWQSSEWDAPRGPDHWNWEGGPVEYGSDWNEVREEIVERDTRCQKCGCEDGLLDVHHITPLRAFDDVTEANRQDNLILLCRSCHMKVEKGDEPCPTPDKKVIS